MQKMNMEIEMTIDLNEYRAGVHESYTEVLDFIKDYLLREPQLDENSPEYKGFLLIFDNGENTQFVDKVTRIVKCSIGQEVLSKFGYLATLQNENDILIRSII